MNNITAKKNADGSVAVQFGGCNGKISNCLPIMPGWNYMVRLFRPRAEVLNGKWKFPKAQLVNRFQHEADSWLKTRIWGFIAGALAGLAMLLTMVLLRLFLGWPTPTELIFDRVFPLLTVEFFIGSLVRAGGYTPLKLQGVFGALSQWTPDEEGEAKVLVRATDGEGQEQISEYRDQVPDGATGLHRVKAGVEKT